MLLDSKQFEEAIKQLSGFVSKKEYREVLQGIHIYYKNGDDYITMEATDSFIVNIIKLEIMGKSDYDEDIDIILRPFKFKSGACIMVEVNFKELYLIHDGMKTSLNIMSYEEYPDLNNILPSITENILSINVKTLKSLIKGLHNEDYVSFNISDRSSIFILDSIYNKGLFKDNIMAGCRKK